MDRTNILLVFVILCFVGAPAEESSQEVERVIYDSYFGEPITTRRRNFLESGTNVTALCTVAVKPCNKNEGRRADGTCSNPKYPSRGAAKNPFPRLLPPKFGPAYSLDIKCPKCSIYFTNSNSGNSLRPARDGSELPSARALRTALIGQGHITSHHFSTLAPHFQVTVGVDSTDLLYLIRIIQEIDCCPNNTPSRENPVCIPIPVPADDPQHRMTGIRCLNVSRVITFQEMGCLPNSMPAERFSSVTPLPDLSLIYGNTEERTNAIRANHSGLLAFRMEGGREVPAGQSPFCLDNRPNETVCYNFGRSQS
ncbi:peroxidase-like [Trichoplusia ni]|uniref:Peroxidase-like n=1 Tax=Trichoplusia ni TaxID=7111 RepID=A0A7E5WEZ1_TRINI|nr:peroxidase-like [Trichoplusia ni]